MTFSVIINGLNTWNEKVEKARALNISATVNLESSQLQIQFVDSKNIGSEKLFIEFRHATLADKDFRLPLIATGSPSDYRAILTSPLVGKWKVAIYPAEQNWILRSQWLPGQEKLELN